MVRMKTSYVYIMTIDARLRPSFQPFQMAFTDHPTHAALTAAIARLASHEGRVNTAFASSFMNSLNDTSLAEGCAYLDDDSWAPGGQRTITHWLNEKLGYRLQLTRCESIDP